MDLTAFAEAVGDGGSGDGRRTGDARRTGPGACGRSAAPVGIDWIQPAEMTVSVGAGTPVAELDAALAAHGQRVAMPPGGTVGGALAVGRSGIRRLGDGPSATPCCRCATCRRPATIVKAGGPTVKNVSGFDLPRLLVGSRGTLGFLGDVILRTRPAAALEHWYAGTVDPTELVAPPVPTDGGAVGRHDDVGAARGRRARRRGAGRGCSR